MKKLICLLLTVAIIFAFSSCNVSRGEKVINDVDYKYNHCVVKPLSGVEISNENDYKVITTYEDMQSFISDASAQFDTASEYKDKDFDYQSASFDRAVKRYNDDFFYSNDLVVIRRFHVTDKPLMIDNIDINNNQIVVNANLETGGDSVSFYRYYFISVNKGYGNKKTTVTLNTNSVEATTSEFDDSVYISKGYNYKLIKDLDYADKIIVEIKSYKLFKPETEVDTDNYQIGTNDCMIMGNGFSALITEKFIVIDDVQYQPNDELRNRVVDIYNHITEKIHTDQPPVYETGTMISASDLTTKKAQ